MNQGPNQFDEVAPLTEFQPLLITTPAQLDAFWPLARPLLDRCVKETMHGELEIDDIRALILTQQAFLFVLTNDRTGTNPDVDVRLALAVEIVQYPRLPTLNVLAIGGTDLSLFHNKFWKQFCGWAYMNGVRAVDGWVGPAMKRILTRFGFKQVYSHMRLELTEAPNV
jgi:hypothetical protein